ncbi:hypothetical protein RG903_04980 [Thermithiobacillus tepidarius DSM 3134]|uniref:hypothetical protein n=1 Tax=Thermithiobacillus tepidarius TaxID=929 RepID=UPI0012DC05D2|nr:hypothetical protein [Thermithiobacillus tepidarius]
MSHADIAVFAIILPNIRGNEHETFKHLPGIGKVDAAFLDVFDVLLRIPFKTHKAIVTTTVTTDKRASERFRARRKRNCFFRPPPAARRLGWGWGCGSRRCGRGMLINPSLHILGSPARSGRAGQAQRRRQRVGRHRKAILQRAPVNAQNPCQVVDGEQFHISPFHNLFKRLCTGAEIRVAGG